MSIQELVANKQKFIGKDVEVGPTNLSKEKKTLLDMEIWKNAIMLVFRGERGDEVVLPQEEITSISLTEKGFYISSPIICVASL